MKRIKGLTLIKLFPVAAIIGIITVIAVPGYLGKFKKEKVDFDQRNVMTSMPVLPVVHDSIVAVAPFSLLPSEGQEECMKLSDGEIFGDTCESMYSQYANSTCTTQPNGTSDIICAGFFQNDAVVVSER